MGDPEPKKLRFPEGLTTCWLPMQFVLGPFCGSVTNNLGSCYNANVRHGCSKAPDPILRASPVQAASWISALPFIVVMWIVRTWRPLLSIVMVHFAGQRSSDKWTRQPSNISVKSRTDSVKNGLSSWSSGNVYGSDQEARKKLIKCFALDTAHATYDHLLVCFGYHSL